MLRKKGMNKKGFELGWQFFFNLFFIIMILIMVVFWINGQASGNALKKQVLAKDLCIAITEAQERQGTTITIEHDKKISIEKKGTAIVIKEGSFDQGYIYPCYLQDNALFTTKGNATIIEIK
ncbi:MAG: hypothetical protein N3G19_00370 [Candidatus Pacearchaeota archaeon]|nr:hypothetical protein [Candidatus Pacearchaeota archaeon]